MKSLFRKGTSTSNVSRIPAVIAGILACGFAAPQARPLPRMLSAGADQTVRVWGSDGKEVQNILAHDATVTSLAVSNDGRTAFTGSADRTIKSWNLEDESRSNTFEGHAQEVTCISLSPDGRVLASGSSDQTVRLWNTLTGMQSKRIPAHSKGVRAVAWSPDGNLIASAGSDKLIQVWRADGSPAGTIVSQDDAVQCLGWTKDSGSILAGDGEGYLKLWNARDLTISARHKAHDRAITAAAVAADGIRIATAGADGRLKTWTYANRGFHLIKETQPGRSLTSVSWSSDGAMLATGASDRSIRYWNVADLAEIRKVNAHDAAVTSVVFLPSK